MTIAAPYIIPVRRVRGAVRVLLTKTDTTTVTNTVDETSVMGTLTGSATLPADFLQAGRTLRVTASGIWSSAAAAPGTIQLRLRLGGIAGTVILTHTAGAMASSITDRAWFFDALITCQTVGASGTVRGQGRFHRYNSETVIANAANATTAAVTVNTRASQQMVLSVQFNTADTGNIFICTNMTLEAIG